jgi:flagellar motor switch protein FliM
MEKVLSQDEIDSLLGGITGGKVETETDVPESEKELEVFDFASSEGPSRLKLPALGTINERFVNLLKKSLSSVLGWAVNVNITSTDPVKFNAFCLSLPLPTSLNIFKMEPLRGLALLVVEAPLVFSFLESFFGGKGVSRVKLEGRDFTTIEIVIIEKIVKIILRDFQQAWSEIHPVEMVFARTEMDPQFAEIVPPGDMVIAMRFAIDLENTSGKMTLCIPYSTLEPIREKLKSRFQDSKQEVEHTWRGYFEEKIKQLPINVSGTLGTTRITGRKLLEMKIDDIIQLDQKISAPIIVKTEGIAKFKGYPGTYNKKKAIRIEGRIEKE